MFDIGWSEMAVILLVALIVIGPKDLPRVARTMGSWAGKGRAMAREFQTALEDMAREAELDKVKSEIEKAGRTRQAGRTSRQIEKTIDPSGELSKAFDPTASSAKARREAQRRAGCSAGQAGRRPASLPQRRRGRGPPQPRRHAGAKPARSRTGQRRRPRHRPRSHRRPSRRGPVAAGQSTGAASARAGAGAARPSAKERARATAPAEPS